jgi:hypothetical protein
MPWDLVADTPSACSDHREYDEHAISAALGQAVTQPRGARMVRTEICSFFGDDVRVDLVTQPLSTAEAARTHCQRLSGNQEVPLSADVQGWFGTSGVAAVRGTQCIRVIVSVHAANDADGSLRIAKAIWSG